MDLIQGLENKRQNRNRIEIVKGSSASSNYTTATFQKGHFGLVGTEDVLLVSAVSSGFIPKGQEIPGPQTIWPGDVIERGAIIIRAYINRSIGARSGMRIIEVSDTTAADVFSFGRFQAYKKGLKTLSFAERLSAYCLNSKYQDYSPKMKLTFLSMVAAVALFTQGGYAVPSGDPIIHCRL